MNNRGSVETLGWIAACVLIATWAILLFQGKYIFMLIGVGIVIVFCLMVYFAFRNAPTMPDDFEE